MSNNTEYTPASILKTFNNCIEVPNLQKQIIHIKGIYLKSNKNPSTSGYYFDYLRDEIENYCLNLCVPQKIRNKLIDNKSYVFKGYFNTYTLKNGTIGTNITIVDDAFSSLGYYYTEENNLEFNIRKQKANKGYQNLSHLLEEKLYKNEKPSIAIITGKSSQALGDISSTIGEIKHNFNLQVYHVNITSKLEIIEMLYKIGNEDFDIILLTRGGGSIVDFDVFNNTDIAEVVLNLNQIFVTAIGHAEDTSLLQEISDRDFITPTDFGNYLKDTFMQVNNRIAKENNLQEQIDLLKKEQVKQIENYRKKSICLLILGVVVGLIINRFLG